MIRTLYAIGEDVLALGAVLDATDGDLSKAGEQEAAVTAWLASLETEQAAKLDGYLAYLRQLDMEAAQAKAEADEWAAKRRAREQRADYLRARLLAYLEHTKQPKVTTASGRVVSVVNNGGAVPIIWHEKNPEKVPEEYTAIQHVIDTAAVAAALKDGKELAFAELGQRGKRLSVK